MNFYNKYSIKEILEKIKKKTISPSSLIRISKKSFQKYERKIYAWNEFGLNKNDIGTKNSNGLLAYIPFGVKDIYNTEKFKTEKGSPLWKNYIAGNNARVVDNLINNGAILIGKTITAEFAVHFLNKTKNPYDITRTPGTSSSGSAACVSVGNVPFALASQTAGSISRPSSFCGVWGMKPSFGLLPRTGVLKTSDTLDTLGFITSRVDNLHDILDIMRVKGPNYPYVFNNVEKKIKFKNINNIKIGYVITDRCLYSEKFIKENFKNFCKILKKNFNAKEIIWPKKLNNLDKLHNDIYTKNLSYYFDKDFKKKAKKISKIMKKMILDGKKISTKKYLNSLNKQKKIIFEIDKLFDKFDLVFSIGTGSTAVKRDQIELPDSSLIWTLSHIPSICFPFGRDNNGLPYGFHAISKKWNDFNLINILHQMSKAKIIKKNSFEPSI